MEDLEPRKQKQWPKDEGDMVEDDDEGGEVAGSLEHDSYKELENKLTEMEIKANDFWNQQLRTQAELDNVRRRSERDVANAHKYALEKFVNDLLPVIDSLERALQSDVSDNAFAQNIHTGIELTMDLFLKTLEKYGVKQLDPQNEIFNPELHQAIATQPSDAPANTVLEVLQRGYLLNDRLIRPALVVVAAANHA
ncbi:MAG: nucleotide exchange factor GrpE [Gammaproteobacteria bacterium]|nr:nucleotide exchange factor GrpE [Gammaproteobacteria bacterium]